MTVTVCPVDAYSLAFDAAWEALEEAIVKTQELNDHMWAGDVLVQRAPAADVSLLANKLKELTAEIEGFKVTKEPTRQRPVLPGELHTA